jgi:hypothetical protein
VKFEVFFAASMEALVFWDIAPCSQIKLADVSEIFTAAIIRVVNPDDVGTVLRDWVEETIKIKMLLLSNNLLYTKRKFELWVKCFCSKCFLCNTQRDLSMRTHEYNLLLLIEPEKYVAFQLLVRE